MKGSDLREVSDDEISLAMARINYRPKKCLGFKQPAVIFKKYAWLLNLEVSHFGLEFGIITI
ncbi:hypothetical protein VYA_43380 (plasmid) [Vibrio alfacsensis]|nr:hypothetical protein [Vibrio sp. 04Ya108]BCN24793.1 hypothetical protein VYA_19850 [Vibrio alfacsensis]BCN27146.1 hypothetical protein VYA_43380 [Vibrio alfacsensis]